MSEAPARTRICLACRTLFAEGESCPGGGAHQTVSLRKAAGLRKLDDEVWGPDSRARKARQAAKAGAGGAGLGGLLDGCTGCDVPDVGGEAFLAVLAVIVAAGAAIVLFFAIRAVVRFVREKLDRPKPHGALANAPKPKARAVVARGVIQSGKPMALPWAPGSVLGYAMQLYEARTFGGGAMLRDAATAGFDVHTDDGRVVRVPAGRLRVVGALPRVEAERARVEGLVGQLTPKLDREVFPFDRVRGVALGPGERVEVLGELERVADTGATGYRANASVLVPVGVPVLRVVRGQRIATPESVHPATRLEDEGADLDDDAEASVRGGTLRHP